MKLYKSPHIWVLIVFAGVLVVIGFKSGGAGNRPQNKSRQQGDGASARAVNEGGDVVRLSASSKPASGAAFKSDTAAAVDPPASRNAQLQTNLVWSFGGKQQTGWNLYTPLIANLIGASADAAGSEFALRLSVWQTGNGIPPTGTLDGATWSKMVSTFQSRRINNRPYSTSAELVTIPALDCYDSSRPDELRKADSHTFAAYRRMVAAAVADSSLGLKLGHDGELSPDEKFLKIVSAHRSRAYQDHLRKQSPNSGRAGLAVNSPHSTGRALDLYVGGEPVSTKLENRMLQTRTAVYRWLVKNASRFGFQPYFYEPWHWEYVGNSAK